MSSQRIPKSTENSSEIVLADTNSNWVDACKMEQPLSPSTLAVPQ